MRNLKRPHLLLPGCIGGGTGKEKFLASLKDLTPTGPEGCVLQDFHIDKGEEYVMEARHDKDKDILGPNFLLQQAPLDFAHFFVLLSSGNDLCSTVDKNISMRGCRRSR